MLAGMTTLALLSFSMVVVNLVGLSLVLPKRVPQLSIDYRRSRMKLLPVALSPGKRLFPLSSGTFIGSTVSANPSR